MTGIGVHDEPESVFTLPRNTQGYLMNGLLAQMKSPHQWKWAGLSVWGDSMVGMVPDSCSRHFATR